MPFADYIFIFLILLIILLFYLAMKHFKFLFFYLGVLLGVLIGVYGSVFINNENFNLGLLNLLLSNIDNFFKESIIVNFLSNNLFWFFCLLIIALFHRFVYYSGLLLLHFLKWLSTGILTWLSNRKNIKKKNIDDNTENIIINTELKK